MNINVIQKRREFGVHSDEFIGIGEQKMQVQNENSSFGQKNDYF